MKNKRIVQLISVVLAVVVLAVAFMVVTSHTQAKAASPSHGVQSLPGTPYYTTLPASGDTANSVDTANSGGGGPLTVPFWKDAFTYQGTTYPFKIVGTDPSLGSATTVVPTAMIPLNFIFSNGVGLDGAKKVQATLESPIFEKNQYASGNTQFTDANQRAEFWNVVGTISKGYHVLLGKPVQYPTITINVPVSEGQETALTNGTPLGEIAIAWFDMHIRSLIISLGLSPQVLPIFATYNIFLHTGGNPANCCVLGYHSAFYQKNSNYQKQIFTYMFASYSDPGIFGKNVPIEDIHALSHEISEWMNDPFVNNAAPNWMSKFAPEYGCNGSLEVGDPLVGKAITVGTYHPQDEAFFSWFARDKPSLGINGMYDIAGLFHTFSTAC